MSDWIRVTSSKPCPICKKPDWCMVLRDGSLAICPRTSDGAIKYTQAGYLHRLGSASFNGRTYRSPSVRDARVHDWSALTAFFERQATDRVTDLAESLGVSVTALRRLRAGLHGDKAWTFPMYDGSRKIVGIRIRHENGSKKAINGSKSGLFIPDRLHVRGVLYVCEGPTDTAALLSIGLDAVGRASCMEGAKELAELVNGSPVVIVADADRVGRDGADRLARTLTNAKVIEPPDGIKDARAWVNAGATAADVEAC